MEHMGQKSFDAGFNFQGMGLPDHAAVYVEAYHKTDYMRYPFGTVSQIRKPDTRMGSLGRIENLHFRVKIVDESGNKGLILAVADGIKPEAPPQRRSILPVDFKEMGNQIWRLSFDADGPILELNSTIPFIRDKAKRDPRLFFYIFPSVIRNILIHLIFYNEFDSDEPEEWHRDWLNYGQRYAGPPPSVLEREKDSFDWDEVIQWIDRVVTEFGISHQDEWDKLIQLEEKG